MLSVRTLLTALAVTGLLAAQGQAPAAQHIAAHVRPNDLKADVSFLASDALQGRATPSPGLDLAAEYIAAQFRRAGLEPVGDDGYFQNASYQSVKPNPNALYPCWHSLGNPETKQMHSWILRNSSFTKEIENLPISYCLKL